ncbi:hypothetical protein B0J14DRAFT_494338 [Halenospora varia]|nr:hypothetical protein B0J14DRAFT_494338 [Halenospora varia]
MSAFRCDEYSKPAEGAAKCDTYLNIISITRLYVTLDKWVAEGRHASGSATNNSIETSEVDGEREDQLDLSLAKAIHCFSARWLYLGDISGLQCPQYSCYNFLTRLFWRTARKDMLKVINKISYRSVLTLLLFGLTPTPTGLDKDEEADGLTGQICMRLGLEMLHQLRVQLSAPQFYTSKVLRGIKDGQLNAMAEDSYGSEFISIESAAYAAGMIFDNDPTLLEDCRFTLSSGLLGFESEPIFGLFKPQARIFHDATEEWRRDGFDVSNENVSRVVLATATWTYYFWKIVAIFKEALREGYDNRVVATAYTAVLDTIQTFKITYRPLMDICQQRLQFLPWRLKFGWYNTMLRYHLSILKLLEAIERNKRIDLLPNLKVARSDSEQGAINILKFGLDATAPVRQGCEKIAKTKEDSVSMNLIETASFIAIDPWPDNIIATVQLVSRAINGGRRKGLIGPDAFDNLRDALFLTVQQLPSSSKHTHTTRNSLYESMFDKPERLIDPTCPTLNVYSQAPANTTISTYDHIPNRVKYNQQHIQREACCENHLSPFNITDEGMSHDLIAEINNFGLSRLSYLISSNDIRG